MVFQYPVNPKAQERGGVDDYYGSFIVDPSVGFPVTSSASDADGWRVMTWMGRDGQLGETISKLDSNRQPLSVPGTKIYSVADGEVVAAQRNTKGLQTLVIEHTLGSDVRLCSAFQGLAPAGGLVSGSLLRRGDEIGALTGNELFYVFLSDSFCDLVKSELDSSGYILDWSSVRFAAVDKWENSPRTVKVSDTTGFPKPRKSGGAASLTRAAFITPSFFINDRANCRGMRREQCQQSVGCGLFLCDSGARPVCDLNERLFSETCARPPTPPCTSGTEWPSATPIVFCQFPFDPVMVEGAPNLGAGRTQCTGFEIGQPYGRTCFSKGMPYGECCECKRDANGNAIRPECCSKSIYRCTGNMHSGIDFTLPFDSPIYSPVGGTVICAGDGKSCPWHGGPCLDLPVCGYQHEISLTVQAGDYIVIFGHLNELASGLKVGDTVVPGQLLATSGSMNGPHLHFEIREKETNIGFNPYDFFTGAQKQAMADAYAAYDYGQICTDGPGGPMDQPKTVFGKDSWPERLNSSCAEGRCPGLDYKWCFDPSGGGTDGGMDGGTGDGGGGSDGGGGGSDGGGGGGSDGGGGGGSDGGGGGGSDGGGGGGSDGGGGGGGSDGGGGGGGSDGGGGGGGGSDGGGGGGTTPGSSWGDPHIVTFDGLAYDFQAVGEFVVLESTEGAPLLVQARQQPLFMSRQVSINTAVAAALGADRVALYVGRTTPLLVNGVATPLAEGATLNLTGGGKVSLRGSRYTFTWPASTGEHLDVELAADHLDLHPALPASRKGQVRGLFGDFNGERSDDVATRTGTVLSSPTFQEFHGTFVESWRVTLAESLFDYASGESPDTFTDRTFPSQFVGTRDLPDDQRTAARTVCTSRGITDATLLDACTLDVALSGNENFANSAAAAQPPAASYDMLVNLAANRPVTVSGTSDGDPRLITNTVFAPEGQYWRDLGYVAVLGAGSYLIVDLGEVHPLARVVVQADNNDGYLVESSLDGATWSALADIPSYGGAGMRTRPMITLPSRVDARYVRISPVWGDNAYSISELELYGPAAPAGP
ncbi:F5/8 type C domain-containing protein [Archangium gephyra]|uniref:F5/8 type C domain-containing protein n=2 Tax=Archangium gephyra TaxID=48 RepID=A0AAC8TGU2_9BACT|nr:PE-PGRS family protein [Archangium gephyra]REG23677.1 F5/8 type C domain-containing protein [Archangium gephyra]